MALSRDEILGLQDIDVKEIEVPGWNATVYIRKLTRGQQDAYAKRRFGKVGFKGVGKGQEIESSIEIFGHDSWLVAQSVCDENGNKLFSDKDVEKLNEKSGEAIGFIAVQVLEFSGMKEDVEALEEAKN